MPLRFFSGLPTPAYNAKMKIALCSFIAAALLVLSPTAALAQTAVPTGAPVQANPARPDKKIERIRTEDTGARIDELRVGGETQLITVQPKNGGAAYEVKPAEGARGSAPAAASSDTNGSRVWNVLKF